MEGVIAEVSGAEQPAEKDAVLGECGRFVRAGGAKREQRETKTTR